MSSDDDCNQFQRRIQRKRAVHSRKLLRQRRQKKTRQFKQVTGLTSTSSSGQSDYEQNEPQAQAREDDAAEPQAQASEDDAAVDRQDEIEAEVENQPVPLTTTSPIERRSYKSFTNQHVCSRQPAVTEDPRSTTEESATDGSIGTENTSSGSSSTSHSSVEVRHGTITHEILTDESAQVPAIDLGDLEGISGASDSMEEIGEPSSEDRQDEDDEMGHTIQNGSSSDEAEMLVGNDSGTSSESDSSVAIKMANAYVYTQASTFAKHSVAQAFYNTAYKQRFRVRKLVNCQYSWKSYRSARRRVAKNVPKIMIDHYFRSKHTGQEKLVQGTKLPEKRYMKSNMYDLVSTWSRVKIADALRAHDKLHETQKSKENPIKSWFNAAFPPVEIVLSMDGVPIDNSSGHTLEVVSMKLPDCDQIYPIGIHIGKGKEKDLNRIFDPIIDEIATLNVKVCRILADSPQRTTLLNTDAVTAYFGCTKCYARGSRNEEKQAKGDGKGASVLWPTETLWQPPRTMESWLEDILASAVAKQHGVKGDTPARKLVSSLITDFPLDTFHILYLGMVKRLLKQLLRIKDNVATGIMKEVKAQVDKNMQDTSSIQYPSDVSRHPRPINLAVYKSSEYRNLVSGSFFLLTDAFEQFHQTAANKLWGYFLYLVKAFLLPEEQYNDLKSSVNLKSIMTTFYHIYVRVCKKRSCAPNVHMFHHLLEARDELELSQMSTEVFESSYGILKKCYQPGTKSQGKQMLERMFTLLLAQQNKHHCRRNFRIRPKTKAKYNDSVIATKNHHFYRVEGKLVTSNYACKRLVIGRFDYPHAPALHFGKIWTHKLLGELPTLHEVSPNDIVGKAIICKNVITLMPHGAIFG